jgi:hypothetical protein
MSSKDVDLTPDESDEPLHDEAVRKALSHAPDRATLPDWRIRQAILDHAHDAVSASEELLAASREREPWWRLAWWRDRMGAPRATPWHAAFVSVLLGVLVTMMWQREPVPGARLDERPVAAPPAASVEQQAPAAKEEARAPEASARLEVPKPAPAPAPAPQPEPTPAPPPPAVVAPPVAPAPAPAPAPAASDALASREQSAPPVAATPPAAAPSESNRAAAAPSLRPPAAARPAPGARSTDSAPPSDFGALSRWTELRVASVSGEVRTVSRADAGELSQLLSSVAIVAAGGPPLRSLPEWRVALERKGDVLAVLEVGRNQVRWTEGKLPPVSGTPSPEALEALRAALRQAVKAKAPARPPTAVRE